MRILCIVFFCTAIFQVRAQVTVADIKVLELGQKFEDAAEAIAEKFDNNVTLYQGDAHDTYRIVSPEADSAWITKKNRAIFDAYGGARITYQFAEEVLIAVEIRFEFTAEEEQKESFERTLRSIVSGFTGDKDFFALKNPPGQEFDIDKIVQEVMTNCSSKAENEAYQKQSVFMGTAAWEVHKRVNNIPRHKLVTLQAFKTAMTSYPYSGCVAVLELVVSNENFISLYNTINAAKIQYEEVELEED